MNVKINNLDNIIVLNCALSDKNSYKKFYLSQDSAHSSFYSNEKSYIKVKTMKLDDVIKKLKIDYKDISLIKIDVEGHEYFVLKGANKTLKKSKPFILIEIWKDNTYKDRIFNLLNKNGFFLVKRFTSFGENYLFYKL